MKKLLFFALALGATTVDAAAAQPSAACAAKRASIEAQLQEATLRNRRQEVAGLQRALKANKAHCTDEVLAKERETNIKNAQRKVAERERDLAEAQAKGDAKKIASRQEKLEAARRELQNVGHAP